MRTRSLQREEDEVRFTVIVFNFLLIRGTLRLL